MKFLILGLVLMRPQSLYELHARFAAGFSHIYAASYGSIHRALRLLHDAGDIETVDDPHAPRNTKRYTVTAQGRRTWRDWMHTPRTAEDSEASMLARVLLLGALDTPAERRDVLLALHRRALADLDDLRAVDTGAGPADDTARHYPRATLDYGVRAGGAAVAWLEELLEELTPEAAAVGRVGGRP